MSEENQTPETETTETTVVDTAPVVEVKEETQPDPVVVEVAEVVAPVVAEQTEAAPLPGRGSMGIVSPETGVKVKL